MPESYAGLTNYLDAVSALLNREEVRPEAITFEASVSAAAALTNPAPQRVSEVYDFAVTKIVGYFQGVSEDPSDVARLSFTIQDPAEGRFFFRNARNLASLVGVEGNRPQELLPPYILPKGASIEVAFTLDTVSGAWGAELAEPIFRVFGIITEGSLVRPGFSQRLHALLRDSGRA